MDVQDAWLDVLHWYNTVTFLYQLAQARPHNVLHFLVMYKHELWNTNNETELELKRERKQKKSVFSVFKCTWHSLIGSKNVQTRQVQSFPWSSATQFLVKPTSTCTWIHSVPAPQSMSSSYWTKHVQQVLGSISWLSCISNSELILLFFEHDATSFGASRPFSSHLVSSLLS